MRRSSTSGKGLISDAGKCILVQLRHNSNNGILNGGGSRSNGGSCTAISSSASGSRLGSGTRSGSTSGSIILNGASGSTGFGSSNHHHHHLGATLFSSNSTPNGNHHPASTTMGGVNSIAGISRKFGQKESTVHHWNELNGGEWKIYCLISMSILMCYANGLFGAFVHDDIPAIVMNNDVNGVNPLKKLIQNDFWGTPMSDPNSHKSYRPLTTLTFRLNCFFLGLRPIWFHTVNIILHLFATVLFTRFCSLILKMRKEFAIIAGLLFAVHPIHTEAVTGIVGRADVLASIFFMLSLFAHFNEKSPKLFASIVYGSLSMLAKESGLTVLIVNIMFDLLKRWELIRRLLYEKQMGTECKILIQRTILISIVTIVLLAVRLGIFKDPFPKFSEQDNPAAFNPNMSTRFRTYSYLFVYNLWLMLCPSDLSHDWQMGSIPLVTSFSDKRNLITFAAFLILIVLGYKAINFEKLTFAMGFLLMGIPLLPACNIITTVGFVLAERVLYIPSFGFILLVVYGLQCIWDSIHRIRPLLATMLILLLISYACKTFNRNFDWYSRESLLRAGLKVLPHNAKMHYNYGNYLKDSENVDNAILHYEEAIKLWPTYASAHNNLGTLMPTVELAEYHFREAIRFYENHVNAHCNLGLLYRSSNKTSLAEIMLRKCVSLRPNSRLPYLVLAQMENGLLKGLHLRRLAKIRPETSENQAVYGNWLFENNMLIGSQRQFINGLRINPNHLSSYIGICKVFRKTGQRARLLQFILRRHIIRRVRKRDYIDRRSIYLHSISIRHEIRNRAMFYEVKIASNSASATQKLESAMERSTKFKSTATSTVGKTITQSKSNLKSRIKLLNQTTTALSNPKDHAIHLFLRNILYKV